MRILITGCNGFVGRHLCKRLADKNEVVEFDGDIIDVCFDFKDIDHVFHLAGKTFVPDSWKDIYEFYSVNLMGTLRVLEFCRNNTVSLTHVSAYVYGKPEYLPVDENHKISPNSPYNHSKVLADDLCRFYADSFGLNITILRPFNIYGAGQRRGFVMPDVVEQALFQERIEILDLSPRRDFLYIEDFLDVLELTVCLTGCRIYNVGSGISHSVKEIIETTLSVLGSKKEYCSINSKRKNEIEDVVADISKIKKELNWQPKYTLKDGLAGMINSLKE